MEYLEGKNWLDNNNNYYYYIYLFIIIINRIYQLVLYL